MNRRLTMLLGGFLLFGLARVAGATGFMVPEGRELPPLAIRSHRVTARVERHVATTRVEEVFRNNTDRRLEATYVFPIPRDAALTDFAMYINGKRMSGEVLDADRARGIYQDIVRRMKDPGLLELMDGGLLRMRVFPIEPRSDTKVEVSYTHALPFESGVYEYTFPLKTGNKASRVEEDMTVTVEIASPEPITTVYSPTHRVGVTRKDDRHVIAGFEETGAALDADFRLFYALGEADFGLNLLTHRRPGEDGYFALMLAPRTEIEQGKVMPKDVCFVIDTSGSMQEQNRIASARDAVKFCLGALGRDDRFAVVRFSSAVDVLGDGLTGATPEAVEKAVAYLDRLEARGGTDLCGALVQALSMVPPDSQRPYLVLLVTDGRPTVGVTETGEILSEVEGANGERVRVFSFGIAEQLNVALLDSIAEVTRGYSDYVAPGTEIEEKISGLFRKVSHPVLADLELSFGKVGVTDMYPKKLPDLFRGGQVIAFGRYDGQGDVAVRLSGILAGRRETFAYDATFPGENDANAFLPQLWAQRKVAYLLDQIRLHGEEDELRDEVVLLSREFGIVTPYTSYLVLENEDAYRQHGIMRPTAARRLREAGVVGDASVSREEALVMSAPAAAEAAWGWSDGRAPAESGAGAVRLSTTLSARKSAESMDEARARGAVRRVDGRVFVELGGAFVDTDYDPGMETLEIKWGSDAYFALVDALPDVTVCLALGDRVVVVVEGRALLIADEGREEMSVDEIREFFHKD